MVPRSLRNGELTPAGRGMDTEGSVTFIVQDSSAGGVEGRAEVGSALEVSEYTDELYEVALCEICIVSGCHDDRDLDFAAHHEEMDEAADDPLILLLVDWGGILGVLEEVHGVGRSLSGKRVRAAGSENLEDGMKHGCRGSGPLWIRQGCRGSACSV